MARVNFMKSRTLKLNSSHKKIGNYVFVLGWCG